MLHVCAPNMSSKDSIRMSNSLDPDQAPQNFGPDLDPIKCLLMLSTHEYNQKVKKLDQALQYFGPDLDPNCLQRLSTDYISKSRVKQKEVNAACMCNWHVQQRFDQLRHLSLM